MQSRLLSDAGEEILHQPAEDGRVIHVGHVRRILDNRPACGGDVLEHVLGRHVREGFILRANDDQHRDLDLGQAGG